MYRIVCFLVLFFLIPSVGAHQLLPFFSPMSFLQYSSAFIKYVENKDQSQNQYAVFSAENLIRKTKKYRPLIMNSSLGSYNSDLLHAKYFPAALDSGFSDPGGDDLVFLSSDKDIGMLDTCTKHNYLLALHHIDGKIIYPGEAFNFNTYLANLSDYCTGRGAKNFSFYGGVCGVASQLFRVGLASPQVRIDKRRGHSDWYAQYYGEEVDGDDAAVYEQSKQLVFTNTSQYPILIKTTQTKNYSRLFFISFRKAVSNQRVEIAKNKLSPRAVDIQKTIYTTAPSGKIVCKNQISSLFSPDHFDCKEIMQVESFSSQFFKSRYARILDRSL